MWFSSAIERASDSFAFVCCNTVGAWRRGTNLVLIFDNAEVTEGIADSFLAD